MISFWPSSAHKYSIPFEQTKIDHEKVAEVVAKSSMSPRAHSPAKMLVGKEYYSGVSVISQVRGLLRVNNDPLKIVRGQVAKELLLEGSHLGLDYLFISSNENTICSEMSVADSLCNLLCN